MTVKEAMRVADDAMSVPLETAIEAYEVLAKDSYGSLWFRTGDEEYIRTWLRDTVEGPQYP